MIYSPSRHTLQENNSYLDTHFNVPKQSQENNSYLDTHFNVPKQSSIAFHVPRSKKTSEKTVEKPVIVIDNGEYMEEYSLKRKNVTLEGVDSFLLQLPNVKALDLSFNKLTALPRSLPYNICALDMSANPIRSLKCFINAPQAHHLIELKLCHNRISRYVLTYALINYSFAYYYTLL
jgi:Leucine-rich repeat (LRR) protein